MNKFRHALCVILVATTCALRAADKDKDEDENPLGDFMPTNDDLVQYVPKFSMKLGLRALGGAHTHFSGQGRITPETPVTDTATGNLNRIYHDGYVLGDQSVKTNPAGNTDSNTQAGLTNNWRYTSDSQVKNVDGSTYVDMHNYTAVISPVSDLKQNPSTSLGVELTGERDMGSVFNTRAHWGVVVGFAINQISSIRALNEDGTLYTVTDSYRVQDGTLPYGNSQPILPSAPYTSSTTSSDPILISDKPDVGGIRTTPSNPAGSGIYGTPTPVLGTAANPIGTRWRLRGAYVSFRAGPTLTVPITSKLSANFSAGGVLMYVGTSYDVELTFKPQTGDMMEYTVSDGASTVLPGFYADATLQYTMTENSGMYLGAVAQATQEYNQTISSVDKNSEYKAKVDFGNMEGVKAGFLFKF